MDADHPLHVRADDSTPRDDHLVAELTELLDSVTGFEEMAEHMALLADQRRLRILFCLHAHPGVRSSDIARAIDASDSTTSHALALLRDSGLVRARRSGREVRYELADGFAHTLLHDLGSGHLPGIHHHGHEHERQRRRQHQHEHEHAHEHEHEHGHEHPPDH
ncbi:ArsR family transcriptional regulator [Brachybacterium sp. JB7]|uniref:Transcriptional regulator n=1 Tax=Brachybacterium alimentarium TaxID=47845 RepID=A0A2A3YMT2_9MICO|nr:MULTISPECIES: metalloregulator ArsR/SmtB family transcription factor [Brachybacterium]PCC40604.1 transcriptional regulator [Brachybacterium alimentarium]RCS61754.1 ArsR family transcriptional regulator [Brachybacterium sp. JB7]